MKIKSLLLVAFFALCLLPISSYACACCAEVGEYSISSRKPLSFELDELKKLKFGTPNLFTVTEDDTEGIFPVGEKYFLNALFLNNIWKFTFKDEKGKSGILTLPMSATMIDYKADIHDNKDGGETVLYKELRFKSSVKSGTGIFKKGIAPATDYFLVLQGRGNNCMNASDFTHWRLEITGKNASFAFFGELKPVS